MPQLIKVFISSTFRDLDDERTYLVKYVFPALSRESNSLSITPIDLRWGITNEEAQGKKVIDICLRYLYESRPFFIGILGDRYGSTMTRDEVDLSPQTELYFPDVYSDISKGLSITEIEIMNGVLRNPENLNALFFVKKNPKRFPEETEEQFQKQLQLRERIINQTRYKVIQFEDDITVFNEAETFIRERLNIQTSDILSAASIADEKYAQKRYEEDQKIRNDYRTRAPYSPRYENNCRQAFTSLCQKGTLSYLQGQKGQGKSSLLAYFGVDFTVKDWMFIPIYGNHEEQPVTVEQSVQYLLLAARNEIQKEWDKQKGMKKLTTWFRTGLTDHDIRIETQLIKEMQRYHWCLLFDNYDYCTQRNYSTLLLALNAFEQAIRWINFTYKLKIDYRLVHTVNLGDGNEQLANERHIPIYTMTYDGAFNPASYLDSFLQKYSKHLSPTLRENILRSAVVQNPDCLRLLCEYMITNVKHEQLEDFAQRLTQMDNLQHIYQLYADDLTEVVGYPQAKRLLTAMLTYEGGVRRNDLQLLSQIQSSIVFNTAMSILRPFLLETNVIRLRGRFYKYYFSKAYDITGADIKTLAKESRNMFRKQIVFKGSWEHFAKMSHENFWVVASNYISCVPLNEYMEVCKQSLFSGTDKSMSIRRLLMKYGGLSDANIDKAYLQWKIEHFASASKMAIHKARKEHPGQGWKEIMELSAEYLQDENLYTIAPTDAVACQNYIETLILLEDYPALENVVTSSQFLNALWNNGTYLYAWQLLLRRGFSMQQEFMKGNALNRRGLIQKVCHLLGQHQAAAYYDD